MIHPGLHLPKVAGESEGGSEAVSASGDGYYLSGGSLGTGGYVDKNGDWVDDGSSFGNNPIRRAQDKARAEAQQTWGVILGIWKAQGGGSAVRNLKNGSGGYQGGGYVGLYDASKFEDSYNGDNPHKDQALAQSVLDYPRVNDFDGFWGKAKHFLLGGDIGRVRYDSDGWPMMLAPVMGDVPTPNSSGFNIFKLGQAAKVGANTITKSKSVLGHIFRDAAGHVNPSTVTSQSRYVKLFENVANNSANLNPNVLTNFQHTAGGFQGYSQVFRNGSQVWIQTFNGKIINAGVNIIPK